MIILIFLNSEHARWFRPISTEEGVGKVPLGVMLAIVDRAEVGNKA